MPWLSGKRILRPNFCLDRTRRVKLPAVRLAVRGKARYGLTACLALVTTPYLAVWYLGWAVPLSAVDDEDTAPLVLVTLLGAYLLPQTIPI